MSFFHISQVVTSSKRHRQTTSAGEKTIFTYNTFFFKAQSGQKKKKKIKSTDKRSFLLPRSHLFFIFCYGNKHTGLLWSSPFTLDWILMRQILEFCALYSVLYLDLVFFFFFNLDMDKKKNIRSEVQSDRSGPR